MAPVRSRLRRIANSPILGTFSATCSGSATFLGAASGGRRSTRLQRGEDIRYDLEISFEDAMRGLSADLQVPRMEPCTKCHGTGAEPNGGMVTCSVCNGRGEVVYQQSFLVDSQDLSHLRRTGSGNPTSLFTMQG